MSGHVSIESFFDSHCRVLHYDFLGLAITTPIECVKSVLCTKPCQHTCLSMAESVLVGSVAHGLLASPRELVQSLVVWPFGATHAPTSQSTSGALIRWCCFGQFSVIFVVTILQWVRGSPGAFGGHFGLAGGSRSHKSYIHSRYASRGYHSNSHEGRNSSHLPHSLELCGIDCQSSFKHWPRSTFGWTLVWDGIPPIRFTKAHTAPTLAISISKAILH
mmetsp:Transcript_805/g.1547  ORF Transcript_805/g.1547 Transcript_805/m.1547 type:complete len:218 (-) Transcript_805:5-658(-)